MKYKLVTCHSCGRPYPVGGSVHKPPVESSPESAEHHDKNCPVYQALIDRGQKSNRAVHIETRMENACPNCGAGGESIIPVWKDMDSYQHNQPDYIGCTSCHTMFKY